MALLSLYNLSLALDFALEILVLEDFSKFVIS